MTFADFNLNELIIQSLDNEGLITPTPIQDKAIPVILKGDDVIGAAKTGTGKTAAFALPIIERLIDGKLADDNAIRALILTPTRELAAQVNSAINLYARHTPIKTNVVYGGVKIGPQIKRLQKGIDILVATPGRLLDLYQQEAINLDHVEILVFDEADRMLDMGFLPDIKRIVKLLPKHRQTLMFSATYSKEIQKLAKSFMNKPQNITLNPENSTVKAVKQWLVPVDKKKKGDLLFNMLVDDKWQKAIIFTRTKRDANRLTRDLKDRGVRATVIHGDIRQSTRTKSLQQFKDNEVDFLVATDVAARGIDIDQLPMVVNFSLPDVAEDYVHRIGRTGRAGHKGKAISLVCADEVKELANIERLIKQTIPREYFPGFEPKHEVPATDWKAKKTTNRKPASKGHASKHKTARKTAANKTKSVQNRNTKSRTNRSRRR